MADYSLATQIQPFQAPNLLALAAQGQQMQTNALKAQLLQQEADREGQLRQLYATPGFDLASPEGIRQVGALGGPEMAQKAALTSTQMRKAQAELSGEERKLVAEQGAEFRNLLTGLVSMSQSDPQRAAEVYSDVYAKLPEGIKQRYSPTFSANTALQALRTTDQLLAQYAPVKLETREYAGTLGRYNPSTNTFEEATARPASAPAGVPLPALRPAAAADMAQRGQRYAPELMDGAAPANAMTPAAAPSPYGGLNAMAAPQDGAGVPASQLVARQKEEEARRKLTAVGQETLERERAQAQVRSESTETDRRKSAKQVLSLVSDPAIEKLIEESTSGFLQRAGAEATQAVTGKSTPGMVNIGKLDTLAKKMLFDLANGKLGGGFSNEDRRNLEGMLGNIADPNLGANRRVDALKQLREMMKSMSTGEQMSVVPTEGTQAKKTGSDKRPPLSSFGGR